MPLFCDQIILFQVGTAVGSVDRKSYTSYTYTFSVEKAASLDYLESL